MVARRPTSGVPTAAHAPSCSREDGGEERHAPVEHRDQRLHHFLDDPDHHADVGDELEDLAERLDRRPEEVHPGEERARRHDRGVVHDHRPVGVRREIEDARLDGGLRICGGIGGRLQLHLLVDRAPEADGGENAEREDETEDGAEHQRLALLVFLQPVQQADHWCAHFRNGLDCMRIV